MIGGVLAAVALAMALLPASVHSYVVGSLAYAFAAGMAYAAFTAMALEAIGTAAAASKYSVLASLSNFPIWWVGLLLAVTADHLGARAMLLCDAGVGALGILAFVALSRGGRNSPWRG